MIITILFMIVCHRPDGLEAVGKYRVDNEKVCHRPDGLEVHRHDYGHRHQVCHRPDGLED